MPCSSRVSLNELHSVAPLPHPPSGLVECLLLEDPPPLTPSLCCCLTPQCFPLLCPQNPSPFRPYIYPTYLILCQCPSLASRKVRCGPLPHPLPHPLRIDEAPSVGMPPPPPPLHVPASLAARARRTCPLAEGDRGPKGQGVVGGLTSQSPEPSALSPQMCEIKRRGVG